MMNRPFDSRIEKAWMIVLFLHLVFVAAVFGVCADDSDKGRWWSAEVEDALIRSGGNRGELLGFLGKVTPLQRAAAAFR